MLVGLHTTGKELFLQPFHFLSTLGYSSTLLKLFASRVQPNKCSILLLSLCDMYIYVLAYWYAVKCSIFTPFLLQWFVWMQS